ncbi:hypothetical protein [Nocardiopsis sp. LOL_012]|uniref:divisome protein SepX/GlpR n=1 Tax=Nocardiopsis sp. LOL_012 TaxID=3345409 RepID=UPI003A8C757D
MSSSPLYLAIVVVWLIVLVPMLLRKDAADGVHEDEQRGDETPEAFGEELDGDPDGVPEEEADDRSAGREPEADRPRRAGGRHRVESRARIIARRRRRTSGLSLLNVATALAVVFGLGPWWVVAPPVLLLAGHLVLLREAAKADAERRRARVRARRRVELRERREAEEEQRIEAEREAKVIALRERRNQVYDQYADARLRAAGD